MRSVVELWRGELPLGRAFWLWGVLGGGVVALFTTLLALALVTAGAPTWLAVLVFAAHVPWNLVLLVGVWRSAGRPEVGRDTAFLARLAIAASGWWRCPCSSGQRQTKGTLQSDATSAPRAVVAPRAAAPRTGRPAPVLRMLRLSRAPCRECNVELSGVFEFR